jgi:hypothetical protein
LIDNFKFIILDRFRTPLEELLNWKKLAPVIGIDEGGNYRDQFDFLVDILIPEKMGNPPANICSPVLAIRKFLTTNQHELVIPIRTPTLNL